MKPLRPANSKEIYFWNIAGSAINALLSVILLMMVSFFLSKEDGDIFSLAWSFGMQAITIGIFQVRLYQATDISEKFSFKQYFQVRIVTIFLMILYSVLYVLNAKYSVTKGAVIFLVCFSRAIDAFSDLFQGLYQQHQRLDLSGKTLAAHSFSAIIAFITGLLLFHNLIIACLFMFISHVLVLVFFDFRYFYLIKDYFHSKKRDVFSSQTFSILLTCLPLFFNAFIIMDIFNQPKYAIDNAIACGYLPGGSQIIYNVLFLPASVLNLAFIVFRPLLTELALKWAQKDTSAFFKTIKMICMLLLLFSAVILAAGWFLGCPVLSVLYNIDLSNYRFTLIVIIVGGLFNTFMYLMDNIVTVIRRHSLLLFAYLITWGYTLFTVDFYVTTYGLLGAAISFSTSMLLLLACTMFIFFISIRVAKNSD